MADRRKVKKRREEVAAKPTKQEYVIAKYIRGQLPQKKTTLFNHKVDYFVANKAINLLLDSAWAKSSKSQDAIFTTRESVVDYLDTMLMHNFFHRARKIPLSSKESKAGNSGKPKKTDDSSDELEAKKKKKGQHKKDDKKKPEEKKKRKFKLDMHLDQVFVDGSEVFVWIYEPTPWKAWLIGSFFVVGAILLCLFPLWPQNVRKGVYYLSIVAAGFLVVILALAVIRLVVFCVVWGLSMGKHHLWLLPNLTEDVGFLESFWPLYKYDYHGASAVENKDEAVASGQGDEGKSEKGEDEKDENEQKHDEHKSRESGNEEEDEYKNRPVGEGLKKRKKRKARSKSRNQDNDDDDDDENEDDDEGEVDDGESKRPEEQTDTDRETSDDSNNEGDDNFEVLNADDLPESDNSDKPGDT